MSNLNIPFTAIQMILFGHWHTLPNPIYRTGFKRRLMHKELHRTRCRWLTRALGFLAVVCVSNLSMAAGGTSTIATKGNAADVSPAWPQGVNALVNHASRTSGWNPWFTEWPNDVNHYALEVKSTRELTQLISKLAAIKTNKLQIRLSYQKEPNSLGWVTRLPQGNGIPVLFSIGNQAQINEWFQQVQQPFGVLEFKKPPVAVPPTLTIFVQHQRVQLEELKIPKTIDVSRGSVPTIFHKSNTAAVLQEFDPIRKRTTEPKPKLPTKTLDAPSRAAWHRIEAFLNARSGLTGR